VVRLEISHIALESVILSALRRFQIPPHIVETREDLWLSSYSTGDDVCLQVYQPITNGIPLVGTGQLEVAVIRHPRSFERAVRVARGRTYPRQVWQGWLLVGVNACRGRIEAYAVEPEDIDPKPIPVVIRGPGLRRIELGITVSRPRPWRGSEEIWSRSMSAMGREQWERFVTDRFEIVGCGRTGSWVAHQLANVGCRSIGLIDPDLVEPHNLDAGAGLTFSSIERPKAEEVARSLNESYPWVDAEGRAIAAGSPEGIDRIKRADVVVSSVDNLRSLLQVDALCKIYGKPLVTIGSRIRRDRAGFDVAVDVGVFFGGSHGCTLCLSERLTGIRQAIRGITALPLPPQFAMSHTRRGDFRTERAGSLLSVNTTAIGLAMHAIQSGYGGGAGISDRSYTMRLSYGTDGLPRVETTSLDTGLSLQECLCSVMCAGDQGLRVLPRIAGQVLRAR
jgi:hypothetical protein